MLRNNLSPVTGFWSYSRKLEEVGGDTLHSQMRDCLTDQFAPLPFELWRDNDPKGGIGSGQKWPTEIVGAVGRSILFFWIQSPRWLERDVCRLEFDAFRDRIRRIARGFPAAPDPDKLWGLLVTPVHVLSIRPEAWEFFSPEIRQGYQAAWLETQRHRMLDLSSLTRTRSPLSVDTRELCLAAAHSIYDDLAAAATLLGTTLPKLLECAALPDPFFEEHWQQTFYNRGILKHAVATEPTQGAPDPDRLLVRQRRLADRLFGGETRRRIGQLQLDMLLLPALAEEVGFWCSVDSAEGAVAAAAVALPPDIQPVRSSAGYLLWPQPAVRAVLPELARFRLDLPNEAEASALRQALAMDRGTGRRLGFAAQPGSFWSRGGGGALQATAVAATAITADCHPLFVVSHAS